MNMKFSAWGIRNPIAVCVVMLGLLYAGFTSFLQLPIKPTPDTSFPIVQVTILQPGAAPEEMIGQIVRPLEGAVSRVQGVRSVQTQVVAGYVATTVEFAVGDNVQRALDDVRGAVDSVRAQLPRDIEEPLVQRIDVDASPMVTYAVQSEKATAVDLSWTVDDQIVRQLTGVKGVAKVTRVGGVNREVNVVLDPRRMSALGVTAGDVNSALNAAAVDAAGGRGQISNQEQAIRILSAVRDTAALAELNINLGSGRTIKLKDIAEVQDGSAEARGFALLDGRPVIAIQIFKTKQASEVQVDKLVRTEIDAISAAKPGIKITRLSSTVEQTLASYKATQTMLWEGMLLAAIVVAFFLKDWRATLIAAVAMPLSLVPTFWVMHLLGFSLNVVSLLALTLVIGILVDDAIVEIENISKRIARGEKPYQAALVGADEIGLAVVAVTFTIVAIFLPVSSLEGVVGQYFREFGITVSVAVLFSLLVARFVTPLLAAYFLTEKAKHDDEKPLPKPYEQLLSWCLKHQFAALFAGILMFIGSLMIAGQLASGFTPVSNRPIVLASVEGAPGVRKQDMEASVTELTRRLKADPAVKSVFVTIGASGSTGDNGAELRSGTATILLKSRKERGITAKEWQARVYASVSSVPDLRVSFLTEFSLPEVQIILTGEDKALLAKAANQLAIDMKSLEGLASVRLSAPPSSPDLVIRPLEEQAALLGVSSASIADTVRVATLGELDAATPKLVDGERRIPIRVRLPVEARADLAVIGQLPVPTASGATVPLKSVARLSFEPGATRLDRFNRKPQITINAALDGITLGTATEQIKALKAYKGLPSGITHAEYGDAQYMAEMFNSFGAALAAGILAMLAILILLFGSFWKPVTILMALPLSVGGAFGALWLTGFGLDLPAMIGLMTLMGLVAKNSILLVEYAIEEEKRGIPARTAIVDACRQRARPIIMTTVAMVAGMVPTAVGYGEGSEFRQPMAIAVIGGLATSTLLSLVLVPVIHVLMDRLERVVNPFFARALGLGGAKAEVATEKSVQSSPA